MKSRTLRTAVLWGFLAVILFLGISMSLLGVYIVNRNIYANAQNKVKNDLKAARSVFQSEIDAIGGYFWFVSDMSDLELARKRIGLDYLFIIERDELPGVKSDIVKQAFAGVEAGAPRIVGKEELLAMGHGLYEKARISIEYTPKTKPTSMVELDSAMAIEYAKPIFNGGKKVKSVIYGGKIMNRGYSFVDKVRDLVFGDHMYDGKPMGTVTIFQDDVRISTNVLNKDDGRAIGTRVSAEVYENVVEKGKAWLDRAFVVTDWYITGYEPIKDVTGRIIGILYVGIQEKPFDVITRNTLIIFLALIVCAAFLAVFISILVSGNISRPLTGLLNGTAEISSGDLSYRVNTDTYIKELNGLAESFNCMAGKLDGTYMELRVSNDNLGKINKRYLDLIGFVSHELKGILSSTILNAYAVRDGFLGMVNFKQQKALDSITRNLDYLDSTVKNFLNLSRIEKGELSLSIQNVSLRDDIMDAAIDAFTKQIAEKDMKIKNDVDPGAYVLADRDLILIVANNLISNAVKYGEKGGKILIGSRALPDGRIEISVYNDGVPIAEEQKPLLFKRFSRLNVSGRERIKGTGLGLFITKEIIEKHGGSIDVKAAEKGNYFIFSLKKGEA